MHWLIAATIASVTGTFLLSLIHWYLYNQDGQSHLKLWAMAWLAATLHYLAELCLTLFWQNPLLLAVSQATALASASLIVLGTYRLLNRQQPRWLYPLAAGLLVWLAAALSRHLSFILTTLPVSLFWSAALIWTGWSFLRRVSDSTVFHRLAGAAWMIWGLQKFFYPAARPLPLALWGYLLTALLGLTLCLSLLLLHFQRIQAGYKNSSARFRNLAENSPNMIYFLQTVPAFSCTYLNPTFARLTGLRRDDFYQNPGLFFQAILADDREAMAALVDHPQPGQWTTIRWLDRQGQEIWTRQQIIPVTDGDGNLLYLQGIGEDITAHRQDMETIWQQANYDAITGLPNRAFLQEQLETSMLKAKKKGGNLAVLFVQLDQYKHVNDLLGHGSGDQFVAKCAARIKKAALGDEQLLGRWDSGHFVIIWPDVSSLLDVEHLAGKILHALAEPTLLDLYEFPTTAGIGISLYPMHGRDSASLLKCADLAMHQATTDAIRRFSVYTPEMSRSLEEKVKLEESLRRALSNNDFILDYQAQFSLASGRRLVGMEALMRWHHPRQGLLLPAAFLNMTEETGLIKHLGEWVLENACRQNMKWQAAYGLKLPVSVNISAVQFRQQDFVDLVVSVLDRTGLDPALLILEISEDTAMENVPATQEKLRRLRWLGVQIALDNFGIGASSLAHLKNLPVSRLKIDRSFLKDIFTTPHMEEILKILISLEREMRLTTLAEGVENQRQLDLLVAFGCQEAQGHYLAPPISVKEFEIRFLTRGRTSQTS